MIDKIAVVDLETTGLNSLKDEIIEIGAKLVTWPDLINIGSFSSKVKPSPLAICTPEAAAVNGYTSQDWLTAPNLSEIWPLFVDFLSGKNTAILAQNVTFDRGFLSDAEHILGSLGVDYHYLDLCSMVLIKYPQLHSLSMKHIAPYLGIPEEPVPHRAINGALTALEILRKLHA